MDGVVRDLQPTKKKANTSEAKLAAALRRGELEVARRVQGLLA